MKRILLVMILGTVATSPGVSFAKDRGAAQQAPQLDRGRRVMKFFRNVRDGQLGKELRAKLGRQRVYQAHVFPSGNQLGYKRGAFQTKWLSWLPVLGSGFKRYGRPAWDGAPRKSMRRWGFLVPEVRYLDTKKVEAKIKKDLASGLALPLI